MDTKYIITKDRKHFKSDIYHHSDIAYNEGYIEDDIIERGVILDKQLFILECNNYNHIIKQAKHYIGNCLDNIKINLWLKGRMLESQLYYSKARIDSPAKD